MTWLRDLWGRNRGLIAALVVASIALPATAWLWPPGPRLSWSKIFPPSIDPPEKDGWEIVNISPDGRCLLTADPSGVRLRDLATGAVQELSSGELKGRYRFMGAQFLEGSRLVLGTLGGSNPRGPFGHSKRLWETSTGRELVRIADVGDDSAFSNDVVSADGSTYAHPPKFDRDPVPKVRYAGVWKAAWGGEVRKFAGLDPIALSGDGRFLAAGGPGQPMSSILVYDVDANKLVATLSIDPREGARCLALSADGKLLAEDQMPGTVLWDVATARKLATLDSQAAPVRFADGGSLLLLGGFNSRDESSEAWDLAARPPRLVYRGEIWHASPDGRRIIRSDLTLPGFTDGGKVECLELPPGHDYGLGEGSGIEARFSPDGGLVATFERWSEPPPILRIWRYIPRPLWRFLSRFRTRREVPRICVLDTRTKRTVATVVLPDDFSGVPDYELVAGGKSLAVRYSEVKQGSTQVEERAQVWDLPPRRPWWWVAAGPVAIALGLAFDVRTRKRATLASALTRVGSDTSP
jgi:hypothetical protein